jgi:hypothetical protein
MTPVAGSAEKWGPLLGARPRAWAEDEEKQVPTYEEVDGLIAGVGDYVGRERAELDPVVDVDEAFVAPSLVLDDVEEGAPVELHVTTGLHKRSIGCCQLWRRR